MNLSVSNYNINKYPRTSLKSNASTSFRGTQSTNQSKDDNSSNKKIIAGVSLVAGAALLVFIFRKNISKLFKSDELKPKDPPNPPAELKSPKASEEPKAPESPKVTGEPKMPEVAPPAFDGQKTLSEYRQLLQEQKSFSELKTEEEKTLWKSQDEKRMELRRKLKENNVSLVEKKEFDPDLTKDIEAKRKYLESISEPAFNQASKLDYLDMFEKYGERRWIVQEQGKSTIRDLAPIVGVKDNSDIILNKYINIMDKLAQRDNTGMRDASSISFVFIKNAQIMSKETILKFIKVLKKTSFQQEDGHYAEMVLKKTTFKDDDEVKEALKDYRKSLEQFPYKDRTIND